MKIINKSIVNHVGELNIKLKNNNSYEGSGVSVSNCPHAWIKIARASGNNITLFKPDGKFVDYYSITKTEMNQIKSWGIKNNLIEDSVMYYFEYYDDEYEETYRMSFTDKDVAQENAEEYAEYDEDTDTYTPSKVYTEKTIKGTEKLKKLTKQTGEIIDDNALQLLTTFYFESEGIYDGVWWDENLDVSRLSAPRGVIFNSKVKNWLVFKEVYLYAIYLMLNNSEKLKNTDKNWQIRHNRLLNIPTELRFKNENIFIEKIQKDRQIIYLVVGQNSIAVCDYFNFKIYTIKNSSYSDMIQLLKKYGSKEVYRFLEIQKIKR